MKNIDEGTLNNSEHYLNKRVTTAWMDASFFDFNEAIDEFYAAFCCLCFLIGTFGNIVSFLYFKSKKRDISNVIYMLITANNIVVSITVLPVGISFLSKRQPGLIFGNKYGCASWYYIWDVAITLSVFLVLCLSAARTISLLKPFKRQKIRFLIISVLVYLVLSITRISILHSLDGVKIRFNINISRCKMCIPCISETLHDLQIIAISISYDIVYTAPAFAVAISCVISVVVLTRRNRNVQQRELQQSRNRATVTILLFALLYGVCNIPFVVDYIFKTVCWITDNLDFYYYDFYHFDPKYYFENAIKTLLLTANSAANPIFYFWRMPALREYTYRGFKRMSQLNKTKFGRGSVKMTIDSCSGNKVVQNSVALSTLSVTREEESSK